jgi:hypothetical protein
MNVFEERSPQGPRLSIGTAARFLIGDRAAILSLASSRWTPAVGALLVLSGGLARNYDHRDLVHEPWHALHGFPVTVALVAALFGLVYGIARLKRSTGLPGFGRGFVAFLGCAWMMAPMAWLYGIPYERFMDPGHAGTMNAATLGLVAAWRLALVTRILAVVFGARAAHVFWLIFFVIDAIALAVLLMFADRVIDAMGGNIAPPTQRTAAAFTHPFCSSRRR